jgi:hypothetical protein
MIFRIINCIVLPAECGPVVVLLFSLLSAHLPSVLFPPSSCIFVVASAAFNYFFFVLTGRPISSVNSQTSTLLLRLAVM